MNRWFKQATPAHPPTNLRIEVSYEGGRAGRYRVEAYDGDRFVHSRFYDWNVWLGHCHGYLLMPDFVVEAEAKARDAA